MAKGDGAEDEGAGVEGPLWVMGQRVMGQRAKGQGVGKG